MNFIGTNHDGQMTLYYPTLDSSSKEYEDFHVMPHDESQYDSKAEEHNAT